MTLDLSPFEQEEYCYLTTYNLETGKVQESLVWFVIYNHSFYLVADSTAQTTWAKNINEEPLATIRIKENVFSVVASPATNSQKENRVFEIIKEKYMLNNVDLTSNVQTQETLLIKLDLDLNSNSTSQVPPPNIITASLTTYLIILCIALVINSPFQTGTLNRASHSMIFMGALTFLISLLAMFKFGTSSSGRIPIIDGNKPRHNEWNKNKDRNEITFISFCIGGLLALFTGYLIIFLN
jgi:hypothetical protein